MVWVRLDDHFDQNPKIAAVGPLGVALWVTGLAYCNRNLTDGFIPWATARSLLSWQYLDPPDEQGRRRVQTIGVSCGMHGDDVDSERVIAILLEAGLWEEVDGGYHVHDYGDYQPSKEQVEAEREANRERVKAYRATRKGRGNGARTADVTEGVTGDVTPLQPTYSARSNGVGTTPPVPDPVSSSDEEDNALARESSSSSEPVSLEERREQDVRERIDEITGRLRRELLDRLTDEDRDHYRDIVGLYDRHQVDSAVSAMRGRHERPFPVPLRRTLQELFPEVEAATRKAADDEWHPRIENWGDLPAEVTP